jgi:glutamyl-tRNA synthetase
VSQFAGRARHAEVAQAMLAAGTAYKCYSTQAEIEAFRERARAESRSTLFRSPWRDVPEAEHPDLPFVLRVRAPQEGAMTVEDAVQGPVTVGYDQLDDMVLLRADGTPLYMLAVVVDDHDAGVTHVIRGDDHLTNTFRQRLIYDAMGWASPVFAHVPLIFGPDGKKLSKRHGATATAEYRAMGYLAAGMRNYLARLGWAHGDMEVFDDAEAMAVFDLTGINRAPARFDFKRLEFLSGQHMTRDPRRPPREVAAFLAATRARRGPRGPCAGLPPRAQGPDIPQLLEQLHFALVGGPRSRTRRPRPCDIRAMLADLMPQLHNATWERGI